MNSVWCTGKHFVNCLFSFQCGVFSPKSRCHYLNITPANLVRLYLRTGEGETKCEHYGEFQSQDFEQEYATVAVTRLRSHVNKGSSKSLLPKAVGQNIRHRQPAISANGIARVGHRQQDIISANDELATCSVARTQRNDGNLQSSTKSADILQNTSDRFHFKSAVTCGNQNLYALPDGKS